jgi:hypothetical protein
LDWKLSDKTSLPELSAPFTRRSVEGKTLKAARIVGLTESTMWSGNGRFWTLTEASQRQEFDLAAPFLGFTRSPDEKQLSMIGDAGVRWLARSKPCISRPASSRL